MRRRFINVAIVSLLLASTGMTSCIGSFELSNKLLAWNRTIDNKFVNELVFIVLNIVPAYPVAYLADLLVLNTIEFWSGSSPMARAPRVVEGSDGKYLVETDAKGYTITSLSDRSQVRFDFDSASRTWSLNGADGVSYPLVTFVDDSYVKVNIGDGRSMTVEASESGLMAVRQAVENPANLFAAR